MIKKTLSLFIAAAAAMTVAAQSARHFKVNISADGESTLELFIPENASGKAVVCCPGGGYSHLAYQHEGTDWAPFFNQRGVTLAVLKYRMPKGDKNLPLSDAYGAIRMLRDSAAVWSVNPYDIGIMGSSAGGHLASAVSTHAAVDARPNFTILFYPVISMNKAVTHKGSCVNFLGDGQDDEKMQKEWSSERKVHHHTTPPAIILMSFDDTVVPPVTNGLEYYKSMRRQGIPCAMYVYPTGGHGWGSRTSFTYHEQMETELSNWLKTISAPKPGALRVACIGNSITDGYGIDMCDVNSYPAQLQQRLGGDYAVMNCGNSARTLMNSGNLPFMKEPEWRDAKAWNPDVVVIKLGTNDSKKFIWDEHGKEFAGDLQKMIDTLSAIKPNAQKDVKKAKPRIMLCCPIKGDHADTNEYGRCRDEVIKNEIIPIIRQVAKKNKLEVIDLYDVLTLGTDDFQRDRLHPTKKGAGKIAEAVAKKIKNEE